MSSTAKAFNRKDGSGKVVCIRHELALQPGMAVFEEYPDLKDGKVKLDGLRAVTMAIWPGAVHEGNGTMQMVIDERADAKQRDALAKILTGQETEDMATMWWVYAAMSPKKLPPIYAKIDFEIDVDGRSARLEVPNMISAKGEPIRNPVTGAQHRVRIDFPESFEYKLGEIGSGASKVTGALPMELKDSWGLFARLHLGHKGRLN